MLDFTMNTYPEGSHLTEVRGGGTNLHPHDNETKFADNLRQSGLASVDAVQIKEVNRVPEKVYMPEHPQANEEGFIFNAAVNVEEELVEMLEASRQYQNNIEVISTIRALMMKTANLGK